MKYIAMAAVATCLLAPFASAAETIALAPGSFEAPEGLQVVDRSEGVNPKSGKAEGLIVFTKKDDVPRAVFIVTYVAETDGANPPDLRDAAVKIGNPFDPSLTSKDAENIPVGGVPGGRYAGTLPNGLVAKSYVASGNGYRLIVLLKGPSGKPYQQLMDSFGSSIERFAWQGPSTAVQPGDVKKAE